MSKPRNPLIPYVLNSDYEDEVLMVWEVLTQSKDKLLSTEIVSETGIQTSKVLQVLNAMINASLLDKFDVKNEKAKAYRLVKKIDAFSWAMALELGIPEHSLSEHIVLIESHLDIPEIDSNKDASYFVHLVKEKNKQEKEKKKKEFLEHKTQNLMAATEVSKILDDLDFLFNTLEADDPLANYVVETRKAFIQAQKTINKHLENKFSIK
jgi:hypothetical protein